MLRRVLCRVLCWILHPIARTRDLRLREGELCLGNMGTLRVLLSLELVLRLPGRGLRVAGHHHRWREWVGWHVKGCGGTEVGVGESLLGSYPLGRVKLEQPF